MSQTRHAMRLTSSTALLVSPPKKAKVCTVPSDSSIDIDADRSELSDSSFTDDNLRHGKRHDKEKKLDETELGHTDDDNENSLLSFPVPLSFQSYISSPVFYKKNPRLEEMAESRTILLAAYRLEDHDMRRVSDLIFTESGNDLVGLVEAHEKEHMKYAPHHKRAKLDIPNEPSRNIPDLITPKKLPNWKAPLVDGKVEGKTVKQQHAFLSKSQKKTERTLTKARSEVKTNKNRIRENPLLDSKKGRLFSWHSYFTGKILLTLRKNPKEGAFDKFAFNDQPKVTSTNLAKLKHDSSVTEISGMNLPRAVASYWNFRPVLERSLKIQEKVMAGYGDTSKSTRKDNQQSRKMRLMKSGSPTRPSSWFQKLISFLGMKSRPINTNSSWKLAKTQRSVGFDGNRAVRNISKVTLTNLDLEGDLSRLIKIHKDSKTLLRERRQKLFVEAQEFYEDSVMAYRNSFKPKPVPDNILTEATDDKSTAAVPLPPTALIMSSLGNTSKPSTLNTITRFPHLGQVSKLANYSSVSETALLPIMKGRRSLPTMNENPSPEIEVIEDKQQEGTMRGILKKPK